MSDPKVELNEYVVLALKSLKKVLNGMSAGDFCGCVDGDILEYYPDACEEVMEKFCKEFTGLTLEEIRGIRL